MVADNTLRRQTTPPRNLNWAAVAHAAVAAAGRGWPVVPGTFRFGERWFGRDDAVTLRPVDNDWHRSAITDPDRANAVWSVAPYSLLLVCGQGVDVLELPAAVVESAIRWDNDRLGAPIVSAREPTRWLVLVASGASLLPALGFCGVALRGAGAWVALPPLHGGRAASGHHWRVRPLPDRGLPDSAQVQHALAGALGVGNGAGR